MIPAVSQRTHDYRECRPIICGQYAFHILAKKSAGTMRLEKSANLLEQSSFLTILDAQARWILRDYGKTLAWKARRKKVIGRNGAGIYFAHIAPVYADAEIRVEQIAGGHFEIIGVNEPGWKSGII
jgi:hypothetical protein